MMWWHIWKASEAWTLWEKSVSSSVKSWQLSKEASHSQAQTKHRELVPRAVGGKPGKPSPEDAMDTKTKVGSKEVGQATGRWWDPLQVTDSTKGTEQRKPLSWHRSKGGRVQRGSAVCACLVPSLEAAALGSSWRQGCAGWALCLHQYSCSLPTNLSPSDGSWGWHHLNQQQHGKLEERRMCGYFWHVRRSCSLFSLTSQEGHGLEYEVKPPLACPVFLNNRTETQECQ